MSGHVESLTLPHATEISPHPENPVIPSLRLEPQYVPRWAEDVDATVTRIIAEQFNVDVGEVKDNTYLADDLGADSIELGTLAVKVSDQNDCNVSEQAAKDFILVLDVINYVKRNCFKPLS